MNSSDIQNATDLSHIDDCAADYLALARPVLDKIADKWTILILTTIAAEPRRFNDIKRRLDITHKALSDALKRMEKYGLITRTVLPTSPIGVEYAITPLGVSVREPFQAICAWAAAHAQEIELAVAKYERQRP